MDLVGRFGGPAVYADRLRPRQPSGGGSAQGRIGAGEEDVQPLRPSANRQLLRRAYPASSATTAIEIAESATLKTGHQWRAMKSVTEPPLTIRS